MHEVEAAGMNEVVFGGIGGALATLVVGYLMEQRQRRMDAALEYARWVMPIHRALADLLSALQYLSDPSHLANHEQRALSVNEMGKCFDVITTGINFTDVDVRLRLAYGGRSVEVQLLAEYCRAAHDAVSAVLNDWRQKTRVTSEDLSRRLNEDLLPRREQLKSRLIARSTIGDIIAPRLWGSLRRIGARRSSKK